MIFGPDRARELLTRVIALREEGELSLLLCAERSLGTRFNACAISQNILKFNATLRITARVGLRRASLTVNALSDDDVLRRAVRQAHHLALRNPEDEEVMEEPGEVFSGPEGAFSDSAEALEIPQIGAFVAEACALGSAAGVDLAGLVMVTKGLRAYADSRGGMAAERYHRTDTHITASGKKGSGWAEHQDHTLTRDHVVDCARRAIEKGLAAQNPVVLQPRPMTAVLEPQAVGDLLSSSFGEWDQRAKDEGRSAFVSAPSELGKLSLVSDPAHPAFPTLSFNDEGERFPRSVWLDKGRLQQLITPRFWAKKQGLPFKPYPSNLVLEGEGRSLDEMIRSTEDGVLVTRFWYIRPVDPTTLTYTGMTRDGLFRIEGGKVTGPLVDYRFNDSIFRVLRNVSMSGKPVATGEYLDTAMPALKVEGFRFSSLSGGL